MIDELKSYEEFKELENPDYEIDISIREIALMLSGKPLFHITKDKKVIKMTFKHDEEDVKDGNAKTGEQH